MKEPLLIYRGPSAMPGHAGKPIVAWLKGYEAEKVGPGCLGLTVAPLALLAEHGGNYSALMRAGGDPAVCGDCPMRSPASGGNGKCYVRHGRVNMGIGGTAIKNKDLLLNGPVVDVARVRSLKHWFTFLRSAVWGDAAALPPYVWARLVVDVDLPVIGYTHQWRWATHLQATHMASVDEYGDWVQAKEAGWRTFRAVPVQDADTATDFLLKSGTGGPCPASHEWKAMGKPVVPCSTCRLCGGGQHPRRRDVVILEHSQTRYGIFKQTMANLAFAKRK